MRIAACLYVRNEAKLVAEWIAYHAAIGVNHFIIYDNLSSDGTLQTITRCSAVFPITIIRWSVQTKYAHQEAFEHCIRSFRFIHDWILFVDADEFVVPVRDGSLPAFLAHMEGASGVACNWAMYGSSGHVDDPSGLMISNFCRRAADNFEPNRHTKMIVRPHLVRHVLLSHYFEMDGPLVSPDGTRQTWESLGLIEKQADLSICRVNHYFVRSRKQWEAKMQRGYRDFVRPEDEFARYDRNEVLDESACDHAQATAAGLAALQSVPEDFNVIAPERAYPEPFSKGSPEWLALPATTRPIGYEPTAQEISFDAEYYLRENPDVASSQVDPAEHFWAHGIFEGRNPNGFFDTVWYRQAYPDAASHLQPAFIHYLELGMRQGRRPNGKLPSPRPSGPPAANSGGGLDWQGRFVSKLRRVHVQHRFWTDDLLLAEDGRFCHASHGSMGWYQLSADQLVVKWDKYPEDRFVRRGDMFVDFALIDAG